MLAGRDGVCVLLGLAVLYLLDRIAQELRSTREGLIVEVSLLAAQVAKLRERVEQLLRTRGLDIPPPPPPGPPPSQGGQRRARRAGDRRAGSPSEPRVG